jgi:hypothetical protein
MLRSLLPQRIKRALRISRIRFLDFSPKLEESRNKGRENDAKTIKSEHTFCLCERTEVPYQGDCLAYNTIEK